MRVVTVHGDASGEWTLDENGDSEDIVFFASSALDGLWAEDRIAANAPEALGRCGHSRATRKMRGFRGLFVQSARGRGWQ